VKAAVDVADYSGLAGDQQHGPDPTAGQPLDPVGQLVLDVACCDHRALPLRPGAILDSLEESPLALPQLVKDSGVHSKASFSWISEDVFLPQLFQENRGFSSFFSKF